jgi:hypothetical protein
MAPPIAATPAPALAGNGCQNRERLVEAFDDFHTANPPIDQATQWLRRAFIGECAEIIESLTISLREAAWRGSDATMEVTLRQLRETLKAAITTFKEIVASTVAGGEG